MEIVKGAVLLRPDTHTSREITQAIPKAITGVIRGEHAVAVKHKLEETFVLRNIGFDVPSPINYGWQYPGMFAPRDNQHKTSAFATLHRRAFILNAMRTGKTNSALWASEYLIQEGFLNRVLVICPKACMSLVWEQALFETLPHRSVAVLHGDKAKRLRNLEKGTDFCIINHDGLSALSVKTKKGKGVSVTCDVLKGKFDLVICDEADVVGNHRTVNHKALTSMLLPTTWLWLMTGTPTSGDYCDTWGLLKLVCRELPAPSWTQWREKVMVKVDQFRWRNRAGAEKIVFEAMQPAIRFTKEECFDLPPVQFIERHAELSKEQKKLYWAMQRDGIIEQEGGDKISAANAAVRTIKMLQISSGAVRDEQENPVILDSADRINVLCDIMRELGVTSGVSPQKTIVAMPFTYSMEHLVAVLIDKGYRVAMVNGSVSNQNKRNAIFRGWQGDEHDVLVVHPEVTAYGLDLTASESIIYYAPTFGSKLFSQLNERIQGAKQKGNPVIVFISATKLERARYEALKAGVESSEVFLRLYKQALEEEV